MDRVSRKLKFRSALLRDLGCLLKYVNIITVLQMKVQVDHDLFSFQDSSALEIFNPSEDTVAN